MELIFKLKDNTQKIYNLDKMVYEQDIDILFASVGVKEINFINNVFCEENKNILKEFYEKINREVFYPDVQETILKFSNEVLYNFKINIKAFMYRVMGYVGNKIYRPQESLSIRFEEDDYYEIDFNKNIIYCGKEKCAYYQNKYCKKYKQEIPNDTLICKSCFLEAN